MHKYDHLCTVVSITVSQGTAILAQNLRRKYFGIGFYITSKDNESELSIFWLHILVAECFMGYYIVSYSRQFYRRRVTLTITRREISLSQRLSH